MGLQTSENTFGAADKFTRAGNLDYNSRAEGTYKVFPTVAALNTWVLEEQARQRLGAGFGVAYNGELCRVVTDPDGTRRKITITGAGTGTAVVSQSAISLAGSAEVNGWIGVNLTPALATDVGYSATAAANLSLLNTATTDALAQDKGVWVWADGAPISATWSIPQGVPVKGNGPQGFARIVPVISNGSRAVEAAITSGFNGHSIEGLWIDGRDSTANCVGFGAGVWLPLYRTGVAYSVGQRVQAGANVYQCATAIATGTTAPTGTGASIVDGSGTWSYVSAGTSWSPSNGVRRSRMHNRVTKCAVGQEFTGWLNHIDVEIFECTIGLRLAYQHGSSIAGFVENCPKPMELHNSDALEFGNFTMEGGTQTAAAEIDACRSVTFGSLYLETEVGTQSTFLAIGSLELVRGVKVQSGTWMGLNHPTPYVALNRVRGFMADAEVIGDCVLPVSTTANSFDVKRPTRGDFTPVVLDHGPAVNYAPNPDCQALQGWDLIFTSQATLTLDTTNHWAGSACWLLTANSGATGVCYGEVRLSKANELARFSGKRITLAAEINPYGTLDAKNTQVGIGYRLSGGTQVNGQTPVTVSGRKNIIAISLDVPANPTSIGIVLYARQSGTAAANETVQIQRLWIAEGNCSEAIRRQEYVNANYSWSPGVMRVDSLNTGGTNLVSFARGDTLITSTGRFQCIVPGIASVAKFAYCEVRDLDPANPGRSLRIRYGQWRRTTTTGANNMLGATFFPFDTASVQTYGFTAKLTARNTAAQTVARYVMEGMIVWNGPAGTGKLYANGAAPVAVPNAGSGSAPFLLVGGSDLTLTDPTMVLSATGFNGNVTGVAATTIDFDLEVELSGGI